MQFKSIVPGVECSGLAILISIEGFKILPSIASRYFVKHGMLKDKDAKFDPDAWYRQEDWLKVFEDITKEVGQNATFDMGRHVGAKYPVPPNVRDTIGILEFLDLGYHAAHRRNGKPMFDFGTGTMVDGIGHYAARRKAGKSEVEIICDNPYPCAFDHGLLTAVSTRFDNKVRTVHGSGSCRSKGADSCAYLVTW